MQLTIFTDGGARGNPGPAAIGCVVLNLSGGVVHEISKKIGVGTNNEAEYTAVIQALIWLNEIKSDPKPSEIFFKLDSMLVVQQLGKRWKIKESRLQALAEQCWALLHQLDVPYSFRHIPRAENKRADALVNQALDA